MRYLPNAAATSRLNTEELRESFLVTNIFRPGEIALEIVDLDQPLLDLAAVLAGNIFQRHVIVGEPDLRRAGADLTGVEIRVSKNGEQIGSTTDPEAATGRLLDLVVHVATWIGQLGHRLEAGQVIIAGSTIPIIMASPGDQVDYACDPLGTVSVSFS